MKMTKKNISVFCTCATILILFVGCMSSHCKYKTTLSDLDNFLLDQKDFATRDTTHKKILFDRPPQILGGFKSLQKGLKYPPIAFENCIEGGVMLQVLVDENGKTVETKILKEDTKQGLNLGFGEAAVKAIEKIKWKPALKDDKPTKVWVAIPIVFRL